jgi:hypothetical protein
MTDQAIADQLNALVEKASHDDAAKALARSVARAESEMGYLT